MKVPTKVPMKVPRTSICLVALSCSILHRTQTSVIECNYLIRRFDGATPYRGRLMLAAHPSIPPRPTPPPPNPTNPPPPHKRSALDLLHCSKSKRRISLNAFYGKTPCLSLIRWANHSPFTLSIVHLHFSTPQLDHGSPAAPPSR